MAVTKIDIVNAFNKWGTDKHFRHGYGNMYSAVFSRVNPSSILEVGVARGKSLAAWKELFPAATITGIEVNLLPAEDMVDPLEGVTIIEGNARHGNVAAVLDVNRYSVIIDDGSKTADNAWGVFLNLRRNMGDVYIIEDVRNTEEAETLKKRFDELGYTTSIYKSGLEDFHAMVVYNKGFRPAV